MKLLKLLICVSAFLAIAGSPAVVHAQPKYVEGEPGCVQGFYDSSYYNWLSYRNTCSSDVYVLWVSHNSPRISGASSIRAGGKVSTGWSSQEIGAKGGLETYACPIHYLPVDTNGNPITRPVARYSCKYRGY